MAIQEINYDVIQGNTWAVDITVQDSTGAYIDFTGYAFKAEVRDKEGGTVICASLSLGHGITVTGTGKIHVEFTPDQTKLFTLPRAKYEIQSIDSSSRVSTLETGWFMVRPGVIS